MVKAEEIASQPPYNNCKQMIKRTPFDEALAENLSLYCSQSDVPLSELFSTHREISIARLALEKQAQTYFLAIETLNAMLENAMKNPNDKILQTILVTVSAIEEKSAKLIDSAQRTINLLGSVVEIDVDKAKLRAMVVSLPHLVKDVINSVSGNSEMAESISLSLNNKISDMMVAIRFDERNAAVSGTGGESAAITLDVYRELINSVPGEGVC